MKPRKQLLLIVSASLVGLCLLCVLFSIIYSLTPQGRAAATQRAAVTMITLRPLTTRTPTPPAPQAPSATTESTPTPAPSDTPPPTPTPLYAAPGPYPTPKPGLYEEIHANKSSMTDLQFKDYCASLVGQRIHLEGAVTEVYPDYRLQIDPDGGGFLDRAVIKGLPKETALLISKDHRVSLDGTITEIDDFLGLQVNISDPTLYWSR